MVSYISRVKGGGAHAFTCLPAASPTFGFSAPTYTALEGQAVSVQVNITNGVSVAFPVTIECSKAAPGSSLISATIGKDN
jgi:hypothetical protein